MYKTIRSYFQKCARFAFFTTTIYGLRFGTTGFGPRSENSTPQHITEVFPRQMGIALTATG